MRLVAQVKLLPTPEQADTLRRTVETANAACDFISHRAWRAKTFGQYALHQLCYYDVRERFDLTAQMAVRCIAKVSDAYKLDRPAGGGIFNKRRRKFKSTGAIAYDDRILRWYVDKSEVSIWTVDGRMRIPFVCGERQRELLKTRQGESDLVSLRDKFFLSATCNVEEPTPKDMDGALGIDLGVANIAVDSDGEVHSAKAVNGVRQRNRRLRSKLQRNGSHMAKRRLKQLSGRERRFAKWVNHNVSKRIVEKAERTNRVIALEELSEIRDRVKARRSQRATLHSWSFHQLRSFVEYKAQRTGVPVIVVDPRNTSRTCPECGHIDKSNRKSQSKFSCVVCGHAGHADHIAAINIGRRAVVNQPHFPRPPERRWREWQGKAPQLAAE